MDNGRGRSPSRGSVGQHVSPQPSPSNYQGINVAGVDPSIQQAFTTGKFNTSVYNDSFLQQQQQHTGLQPSSSNPNFYDPNFQQNSFLDPQFAGQPLTNNFDNNFIYQTDNMTNDFKYQPDSLNPDFNPAYFSNTSFDPAPQTNINPADLSKVSSPQEHQSPNLFPPEAINPHSSQPNSPASTNGQYFTPQHSRHASLDPSSAYGDSFSGVSFQQHRRAPSDHSDIPSAQHSPFLGHTELHNSSSSPFLQPQTDTSNAFGLDSFTIGDQAAASYRSPRLMPHMMDSQQAGLGLSQPEIALNQSMAMPNDYSNQQNFAQPNILPSNHLRNTSVVSDIGQADQFEPPIINIEPAPVSRQQSFGLQENTEGTLSPPSQNRGRHRSKSDVTFTRPFSRSVSPGLHPTNASSNLSVHSRSPDRDRGSASRESSPGPVQSGRIDKNRRASTSSVGQSRDYILDLADPNRPTASPTGSSTRVQKHPATFQCSLCPKRFTRAYNLRSHLRTHTDERPFVCTVCGKAFARQHDRKRHEGLHSGEKKFVCKGELHSAPNQQWGCGRRFARADALGRHFRSEAGRICIKPLLEEERMDRQNRQLMEQQQQQQAQFVQGGLQPIPQPMMIGMDPSSGTGGFSLPRALLAQYPALQNIDWSQVPTTEDPGELSDVGLGQNSFDASSGGEYYDDELEQGYVSGSGIDFKYTDGSLGPGDGYFQGT